MSSVQLIETQEFIPANHNSVHAIYVNGQMISGAQISAEMQYHPAETQREAMLKAAESLVIGELLRQRAAQLGLSVSEDSVEASDEDFIEALITADVDIPQARDSECAQYYQALPQRFMSPTLLELRHILLACAPDDDEERILGKQKAEVLIEALRGGENFSALARAESACPSKEVGGSLGQISRGQTVPEFERQVFNAEPGLLPRPIESRYGFHVVFIERKVPGSQLPYEVVKPRIEEYLNEKVRTKAIAQYIQTLIAAADIEGYDFGVSASPLMQ